MTDISPRWTSERARQWQHQLGWQSGFNYLPRYAVNFVAMWHADTFAPEVIAQELGWARHWGYNSLRTNLPYALWRADPDGLWQRLDTLLAITERLGMTVILCPLDDCEFSGQAATAAIQPPPITGIHNSRALGSPGRDVVMNPGQHPGVCHYIEDLLESFGTDSRVLMWDLYNEPGNRMIFRSYGEELYDNQLTEYSALLLERVLNTARKCDPQQPITLGAWQMPAPWEVTSRPFYQHPLDQMALAGSDVISFHAYRETRVMAEAIRQLQAYDRPLFCTEWMGRSVDSRLTEQLPLLHREGVHSYHWGLVKGMTQTHLPWPEVQRRRPDAREWFHDVLAPDGTPYDAAEIACVQRLSTG